MIYRTEPGKFIKEARKKIGIKQQELADNLSISLQAVSNWEAGRYLPAPQKLDLIFKILKMDQKEQKAFSDAYQRDKINKIGAISWNDMTEITSGRGSSLSNNVPLYTERNTADPASNKWDGRVIDIPFEFRHQLGGVFIMKDDSMSPMFNKNDYILFSKRQEPATVQRYVVACVRNFVYCRIYEKLRGLHLLKAANPKTETIVARAEELKWCYRVVGRFSYIGKDFVKPTKRD